MKVSTINVHMVIVNYDPGLPVIWKVTGAPDTAAAQDAVLNAIGYHPGVQIVSCLCRDFTPVVVPEYAVKYRPLNDAEKFNIRYNG